MPDRRQSKYRDAILKLIQSAKIHPGAHWVYERLKPEFSELSLGTVYRNLNILTEEGTLTSRGIISGEERFDGIPVPHPHAICSRCGAIMDLPEKTEKELQKYLPPQIPGFAVDIRNTVFYGLCSKCK